MMTVTVRNTHTFSQSDIDDLLSTVIEVGFGPWFIYSAAKYPTDLTDFQEGGQHHDAYVKYWHHGVPLGLYIMRGGRIIMIDLTDGKEYTLDKAAIEGGLTLMAERKPDMFERIRNGDYDSIDADALMQYIAFGDIIYG